jgi:hypothetical protein
MTCIDYHNGLTWHLCLCLPSSKCKSHHLSAIFPSQSDYKSRSSENSARFYPVPPLSPYLPNDLSSYDFPPLL